MNWDDLRYVLAIARERSLSRAGESLGVTHTTVSRRLKTIEEQLGVRLFDRTPDGYLCTVAGQDIEAVAERLEGEVLALEGRVLGRDAELQGKLRVSTLDIVFSAHHAAFASFLERYPSVELTLTATDDEVSLTRREADVALRMSNSPPEHLVGRKLGRIDFAVYASKALARRVGPGASYSDFPWLHWDERSNPRWMDEFLAQRAPGARVAMRVDGNTTVLHRAIAEGIGVHWLACFDGDANPALERVGPVAPEFGRDLWLLTLPELRKTLRIRAFMDHMDQALRGRLS